MSVEPSPQPLVDESGSAKTARTGPGPGMSVGIGQVLEQVRNKTESDVPHIVEFRHVTKIYNQNTPQAFTAIKDVSFVVTHVPNKAEFVCILGSSGCGKSTILRMIAGLAPQHPPTAGEVLVVNRSVPGPGADRGMVFQDYTSFDHRSVLDNITFGLECQGVPRRERDELGREWIEHVGLDVAVDAEKYPHELSGGMRQRVAIARTLILRPRIILMDEPFGALDPQTRTSMQDLLVRLGREVEATVFFVTHSIDEAVFLGDRIYVMGHGPGRILQELEVEPADRPAKLMLRDPRFQETVYYIRDMIDRLEQQGKSGVK
jgi:NitT/TauT family transport system ATP-binding protein